MLLGKGGQDYEALAPMAVFAVRGIADDAGAGGVRFLKSQAGQASDDGLKLVVIGRTVGGERDEGVQGGVGGGQIADPCAALGGQRLEAQRLPGCVGVALDQDTVLRRARPVAGVKALPSAPAKGFVDVKTEFGKGAVGEGLYHAGQAGFGGGVELLLADAGVLEAVGWGLPGLGAVEEEDADVADGAEVVEAASEDVGVDGAWLVFWKAGGGEAGGEDFAGDGEWRRERGFALGLRRALAGKHYDSEIGPAAEC